MSRAFVREGDSDDAASDLPDRLISEHRNLVTAAGLAHIETELRQSQADHALAQSAGDRGATARAERDLRYWAQRRSSAVVMASPTRASDVQFGAVVTIVRDDGRRQTFRIVGEDEADPTSGTLSYVSPLAQALIGKGVGDSVQIGDNGATITAIDV